LQNKGDENVTDSDPCTNGWTGEISLDICVMPVFAILLAVSKDDLESVLSILIKDILAVAIHLTKFVFIWLLVIEPGNINVVGALSLAITSDHGYKVLLDSLEVVESPETDKECSNDDHAGFHVLVTSLCE